MRVGGGLLVFYIGTLSIRLNFISSEQAQQLVFVRQVHIQDGVWELKTSLVTTTKQPPEIECIKQLNTSTYVTTWDNQNGIE